MENCSKRIPYSTGLKFGHAPAKFAQRVGVLSEKQQFLCFSQVPAGSDCPPFRPILYEIESRYARFFHLSINFYPTISLRRPCKCLRYTPRSSEASYIPL